MASKILNNSKTSEIFQLYRFHRAPGLYNNLCHEYTYTHVAINRLGIVQSVFAISKSTCINNNVILK